MADQVDAFHVAFNGSCCKSHTSNLISQLAINRAHFNTPPPLHCIDHKLGLGVDKAVVSLDVPTTDSHVSQLHKG